MPERNPKVMEIIMRRITILRRNLKEEEIEQISVWSSAGTTGDEIEVVDAIGEPDPDCEDEIVLILALAANLRRSGP